MSVFIGGAVGWFPQEYADLFYVGKGLLALVATCLVVGHMMHTWSDVTTTGRRLRYFALLGWAALSAASTPEQLEQAIPVSYRNLGVIVTLVLTIAAMVVSIREDFRRRT